MSVYKQGKGNSASNSGVVIVAILFIALLFSTLPCRQYFPDALIFAYDIETSPHLHLSPHHPLFPSGPQVVFRMLGGLGAGINGLGVMMVWSIASGIIACWLMALTLQAAGFKRPTVIAGLGLFAFSHGIWYFSSTANQNSTPLALHILTLYVIVRAVKELPVCPPKARILGIALLTSIAVLSSQANLVLLLPMIFLLVKCRVDSKVRIYNLLSYLFIFIIISVLIWGYLAYAVLGARTVADFADWQHSYVSMSAYWAQGLFDSLRRTIRGAVDLHLAYAYQPGSLLGGWRAGVGSMSWFKEFLLKAGQAIVLLFFAIETIRAIIGWLRSRPWSSIQTVGILTALPVILFTFIFTPEQVHHRILYFPGILLFIAPQVERDFGLGQASGRRVLPLLIVIISLFLTNFSLKFLPESNAANNIYLNEAREIAERFGPHHDKIIYLSALEGDLRIKYTRYFTECNVYRVIDVVNAMRRNPEELEALFREATETGGAVIVHEDALYSTEGLAWVNKRHGTDIRPGELADFFKAHFIEVEHFIVNDKAYIVMKPVPGYAGGT